MEFTPSQGKKDWGSAKIVPRTVEDEDENANISLYDQLIQNLEEKEEEEKETGKFKIKTLNQLEADKINQMTYDRYVQKFQKEMDLEKKVTEKFQNTIISSDVPEKFQLGTIQKASDENKASIENFTVKKKSMLDTVTVIVPKKKGAKKKRKKKKKKRKKRKRKREVEEVTEKDGNLQPFQKKRKTDNSSVNLVSQQYGD